MGGGGGGTWFSYHLGVLAHQKPTTKKGLGCSATVFEARQLTRNKFVVDV